jgi:hypothetical protein
MMVKGPAVGTVTVVRIDDETLDPIDYRCEAYEFANGIFAICPDT